VSDGHSHDPTNADLMRRLDEIVGKVDKHDGRIKALEADRELVHRLHTRVSEISGKVTIIHDMLERNEREITEALRQSVRELSSQMVATVRAEMAMVRDDVRELRVAVESRPCLVDGEACTQERREVERA
jgi:archaellum component FlaC